MLLGMLLHVRQGTLVIEQPATSIIMRHPRCQFFLRRVVVYKQRLWMLLWGGKTPKRTVLFSNKNMIWKFATAPLTKQDRDNAAKTGIRLVRKHRDRHGKKRFSGNPKELAASATHVCMLVMHYKLYSAV